MCQYWPPPYLGNWINQIKNPGFEGCTTNTWDFGTLNGVDMAASGLTTEDKHSGDQAFKIVFGPTGGTFGLKFKNTKAMCERLNYRFDFWSRILNPAVCTITVYWGVPVRTYTNDNKTTWFFAQTVWFGPFGFRPVIDDFELRVQCTTGGAANAVYIDDVDLMNVSQQGPYQFYDVDTGAPL
jgi:hypothetical protein